MAKSTNQKLKLYYVLEILRENTDDQHGITMEEIIERLGDYDVEAERKSVGSDIKTLIEMGYDIGSWKEGKLYKYYLLSREFDLPEIKLLVDAVQVSKFINKDKTDELIKKIETLVSKHQAKQLNRQVFVANRAKTNSEVALINIDYINTAITSNKQISFEYYDWNIETEEFEIRTNGIKNGISPWMLIWDDENYYMVAYDKEQDIIKHYRVDKMKKVQVLEAIREGRDKFDNLDMAIYSKSLFNMFSGQLTNVKLEIPNYMYSVLVDRFGQENIWISKKDKEVFQVRVEVNVSEHFWGWLVSLGEGVRIISPEDVVKEYKEYLIKIADQQL